MFQTDYYHHQQPTESQLPPQHHQHFPQHSRHYSSYHQPALPQFQPHHSHHYSTNTFFPQHHPLPGQQLDFFHLQPLPGYIPLLLLPIPPLPQLAPAPEPQQVAGGVSAVLDYDVDEIVKFITLLGVNIFKQTDLTFAKSLESKLKHVITATRLPKSTILLSVLYLSNKVAAAANNEDAGSEDIYTNVIISLLLANKFNDDSTFTNKSWSHASGLEIKLITRSEIQFLTLLNYDLKTIMEDDSFRVLENSFDDWCLNNKQKQLDATAQQLLQIHQLQQLSPLEPQQPQFHSSPVSSYYSAPLTAAPMAQSYLTPLQYVAPQLPPLASAGSSDAGSFNNGYPMSSPIANPYANQYYQGSYYNDYYRLQLQQQQQQLLGYYYGLNDQFVSCY